MERPRLPRLPESSLRNFLKVFAAFGVGVIATFALAVVYSRSHQSWGSVRAENVVAVEQTKVPATQAEAPAQRPAQSRESQTAIGQSPPPSSSAAQQADAEPVRAPQRKTSVEPATPQPATVVPQAADLPLAQSQLAQTPPPVEPQPALLWLQPGMSIPVHLADTLSSDRNRPGDSFRAVLDAPIAVRGSVVAQPGTTVFGRISQAHRARLLGRKAELALTLTELRTTHDGPVAIQTNQVEQEGSRGGILGTAKMATGAAAGAVVGALKGAAEGAGITSSLRNGSPSSGPSGKRTVTFPAGIQLTFTLAAPVRIVEHANR
jgi:hypothetical protein